MLFQRRRGEKELLEIFRTFSKEITSILVLKDLLHKLLKTLAEIAEVRAANILLHEAPIKAFVVQESLGGDPLIVQFSVQDPFINFLRRLNKPMTKHGLIADNRMMDVKEAGLTFMTSVNAEAVFPMTVENKFLGILTLGPRRDDKAYSSETLDLLNILVAMGSISIENAMLYESLAKQNLKLSEIASLKTQFVSTVTHELRTPLNGILGLTDVLLDQENTGGLNDDQRRYIQMVHSAGGELLEIVNHILDLTQFQSKMGALDVKKVDIQKTFGDVQQQIEHVLSEKNVQLHLEMGDQTSVYGDEAQITQVMRCLLENAVKFSRPEVPNFIEVKASRQGDMLKFGISDKGIGIDEKNQDVIFEDFRQGDGEATRAYGGAGLGLAIAKKIVERHGGRIWVESKKGEGSQFYFTLPLKPGLITATVVEDGRDRQSNQDSGKQSKPPARPS